MEYVPVYGDEGTVAGSGIELSDAVIHKLGVRTAAVAFGPLSAELHATGIVRTNEHSLREVRLRAEGWVEELSVRAAGEAVRAGQPLLKLYSPRLESAEQEFLASLGFNDSARTALAERRLIDLGIEPAFIATLRKSRQLPHQIPFHVPSDGVITELGVRQGTYADANTFIMRVANLDPAWIIAEIPQSAARELSAGSIAEVRSDAYPGQTFKGRFDYLYPELDAATRSLRVRLVVANKDALLLPNMYVSATLTARRSQPVVHVPRDAVIRDGDSAHVILARGHQFTPRDVRLGAEVGDELVVLKGLADGDRVVTSAIFLIDSEASLKASLARIESGMSDASAAPLKP